MEFRCCFFLQAIAVCFVNCVIESELSSTQRATIEETFSRFDCNGDGVLDEQEFHRFFLARLVPVLTVSYVMGVDVGGTNTDTVLLRMPTMDVIASGKTPTTPDIMHGVVNGLTMVLTQASSVVSKAQIRAIIIGTTVFVNAVIQVSDHLSPVTVLRLCGESTRALPPFTDFPPALKRKLQQQVFYLNGGYTFDCKNESSRFDPQEVRIVAEQLAAFYFLSNVRWQHNTFCKFYEAFQRLFIFAHAKVVERFEFCSNCRFWHKIFPHSAFG